MKWLITGGCGFVGTSLIKRLMQDPVNDIRVVDNLSVGTRADLLNVCEFVECTADALIDPNPLQSVQLVVGDIMDASLAIQVAKGVDVIVHLAANTGVGPSVQDPRSDCMVNVVGTFNYLEASRYNKVSRFIFASSGAPAGEVEPPIHEELAPHPVSPYGASKLAGEGYCSAYKRTFGVDTVCLRFGNVYGPGSLHKSSVVAKFIRQSLAGETLEIFGDGEQTRDFIFIDDLILAVLSASVKNNIGGETFQIASSRETTVGEMAQHLVKILAEFSVQDIHLINTEIRPGDVKRNFSDTGKAKERLGWTSKVGLESGLRKTVEYFINRNG